MCLSLVIYISAFLIPLFQTANETETRERAKSVVAHVGKWSVGQVGDWLVQQDMGLYQSAVIDHKIDGPGLMRLTAEGLDLLGVSVCVLCGLSLSFTL